MASVFISGTDTGVGKTFVTCALARSARAAGIDIGVMKPVETGVTAAGPEDARALREAAGVVDDLSLICPQRFAMPAAPQAAARAEDRTLSLAALDDAFAKLSRRHETLLVEGAGGLLVPLDSEWTMAGLARRWSLPVLLVARASLGTINHTLMSLETCDRHGLELIGVVVSHSTGTLSAADEANLQVLRDSLGSRLVGEMAPCSKGESNAKGLPDILERIARR